MRSSGKDLRQPEGMQGLPKKEYPGCTKGITDKNKEQEKTAYENKQSAGAGGFCRLCPKI